MVLALWSLARLGDRPPEEWIRATLSHILLHAVLYSSPEVWRKKRLPENQEAEKGVAVAELREGDDPARTQDSDAKLAQNRQLDGRPVALQELYRRVELSPSASLAAAVIPSLESLIGRAPGSVSSRWFVQARFHALVHLRYGGMTAQQYMMTLYGLAALQYKPSDKWMQAYLSGSGALLGRQALLDHADLELCKVEGTPSQGRQRTDLPPAWRGQVGTRSVDPRRRRGIKPPDFKTPDAERLQWQRVLELIQKGKQRRSAEAKVAASDLSTGKGSATSREEAPDRPELTGHQDLACLLWCFARVQQEPPTWWMRLYEAVILPRLNTFSVQVSDSAHAWL